MRRHLSQTGVGHLAALLVIVVVAAVAFSGYTVWKAGQKQTDGRTVSQQETAPIETKADLEAAGQLLDETGSQLDQDLDASALDSDIDQLL